MRKRFNSSVELDHEKHIGSLEFFKFRRSF